MAPITSRLLWCDYDTTSHRAFWTTLQTFSLSPQQNWPSPYCCGQALQWHSPHQEKKEKESSGLPLECSRLTFVPGEGTSPKNRGSQRGLTCWMRLTTNTLVLLPSRWREPFNSSRWGGHTLGILSHHQENMAPQTDYEIMSTVGALFKEIPFGMCVWGGGCEQQEHTHT